MSKINVEGIEITVLTKNKTITYLSLIWLKANMKI